MPTIGNVSNVGGMGRLEAEGSSISLAHLVGPSWKVG